MFDSEFLKELDAFNEKSTTTSAVGASSSKSRHLSALSERSMVKVFKNIFLRQF